MPKTIFGQPENIVDQEFLTWWHLPVQINPGFFQRKSISNCSISAYIHGGGVGTIVAEVDLCWRTATGPQRTLTMQRDRKYLAPVSLRSTHWTSYTVDLDDPQRLSFVVPPRMVFLCDRRMMLAGYVPMKGLINDYHFSFRLSRLGRTVAKSGLYKLIVPFESSENSKFTFQKQS